jgi:hypothetical protein
MLGVSGATVSCVAVVGNMPSLPPPLRLVRVILYDPGVVLVRPAVIVQFAFADNVTCDNDSIVNV